MIEFDKDEHIIFEVRKHWFSLVMKLLSLVVAGIIPGIILLFIRFMSVEIVFTGGSVSALITFLYSLWVLILWLIGFIFWTNHYLDIWIITNKKLIDVEQFSLFDREISILHLDKIQDITTDVDGLMATLMEFGDLRVQTAGQSREFVIRGISNPNHVREKLDEALDRFKELHPHLNKSDF